MIRIAIDREEAMPTKGHKWDAGWDLKSMNDTFTINPGEKVKVHTGVKTEIPVRHMGLIVPRSGLGAKFRVGLANTVGVIDSEYRGELMVNLVNDGDEPLEIKQFDRFCQLVIVPVNMSQLRVVSEVRDTARGDSGFGSTGVELKKAAEKLTNNDDELLEKISSKESREAADKLFESSNEELNNVELDELVLDELELEEIFEWTES